MYFNYTKNLARDHIALISENRIICVINPTELAHNAMLDLNHHLSSDLFSSSTTGSVALFSHPPSPQPSALCYLPQVQVGKLSTPLKFKKRHL